jgi:hypothetical protein
LSLKGFDHEQDCFAIVLIGISLAAESPKYGGNTWQETFSLDATEHKYFRVPDRQSAFRIQDRGRGLRRVMTPQEYAQFANGRYLELVQFRVFRCVKESTLEATQLCTVAVFNAMLAVRDKREPVTKAMAGYSAVHP